MLHIDQFLKSELEYYAILCFKLTDFSQYKHNIYFTTNAPSRAFCKRIINATFGVKYQHRKIWITNNTKLDLKIWTNFFKYHNGVSVKKTDSGQQHNPTNYKQCWGCKRRTWVASGLQADGAILVLTWHFQEHDIS